MRWIAFVAAWIAAAPAFAYTMWWVHPTAIAITTTHADGTTSVTLEPITRADIAQTVIEYADDREFTVNAQTRTVNGQTQSVTMPDQPAGTMRCHRVRSAVSQSLAAEPSDWSDVWCRGEAPAPTVTRKVNAPTGLSGN